MLNGAKLRELRVARGVPQYVVAKAIGVAHCTYNCYENGTRTPDINTTAKIAKYYGVKMDDIVLI